jgi:Asp-tRNA(Asn)/Glu-tRNA(Gln) amidotransferase A subunit family amidase
MSELPELSVAGTGRAIRESDISAEALAEALINRAQRHENLNAFVSFDPDAVRENARLADQLRSRGHELGPPSRCALRVKDTIDTASLPTTAFTPALCGHRPTTDALVAGALFAPGVIAGTVLPIGGSDQGQ